MLLVLALFFSIGSMFANGILWGCNYEGCGPNDENTMCRYPAGVNHFQPFCMDYNTGAREMTDELRKCSLDKHNRYRQKVAIGDTEPRQPPAANMMKLRYNKEAEKVVQHWLNQCTNGHDSCRNLANGTGCGQNLFWSGGLPKGNKTAAEQKVCNQADSYFDEIRFFPANNPDSVNKWNNYDGVGHYTAMNWATVREIGCAWFSARDGNAKAGCNYCPTPNWVGEPLYKIGDNCTQCPEGAHCSKRYPGLCTYETEDEEYNDCC